MEAYSLLFWNLLSSQERAHGQGSDEPGGSRRLQQVPRIPKLRTS
jgi:hypothetical protein